MINVIKTALIFIGVVVFIAIVVGTIMIGSFLLPILGFIGMVMLFSYLLWEVIAEAIEEDDN